MSEQPDRYRLLRRCSWTIAAGAQLSVALGYLGPTAPSGWLKCFWAALLLRTMTFHLALLVLLLGLIASWARCWRLAAFCAPLALVALVALCAPLAPHTPPPVGQTRMRVLSINLLMINRDKQPIIDEIEAFDPDVLALQEYSAPWKAALRDRLALRYPYRLEVVRPDSFGIALYSRWPIKASALLELGGAGVPAYRVELQTPTGERWVVYNVHTLPPRLARYVMRQYRQFKALQKRLKEERLPTLVVGDFNWNEYTHYHQQMGQLGFREGHEVAGRGPGATWPVLGGTRYLPGIRLDHMYAGRGLVFLAHQTGRGQGSDHRPVLGVIGRSR